MDGMTKAKMRLEDEFEEQKAIYERMTGKTLPLVVTLDDLKTMVAKAYEDELAPDLTPEEEALKERIRLEDEEDANWAAQQLGR